MQLHLRSDRMRDLRSAAIVGLAVIGASALGQIATFPNLSPWYASLTKPDFIPPNWVFGPVWTALYVLMAFAAWRIFRLASSVRGRRAALLLFFIQLALNAAWSWMFFAGHSPLLGMANIIPQLGVILATTAVFFRLDRIAGACLIPLACWVGFASVLNFAIWKLNA
jgi:translocator protein